MALTRRTTWNSQARGGFTLMELLVAMVLMVAVASSLYTALHTGFRARRSALLAVEPTMQALNAIELIKQDIQGVLPPDSNGLAGAFVATDSPGFKGRDSDSLEFYTTHVYPDEENPNGGVGKIKLLLEDDTDAEHGNYTTYRLVREVTTNLLAPKEVEPEEQILCRDVTSLNFRYYDGDGWVDDWDSTEDANSLPKAVEVEIEVAYFARDGRTVKSSVKEPERRRLIQSFAIPCEAAEETSETSSSGSSSSSGNASGSSSGRPAGGASSGGGGG
ncbi:MAG: prepilin-type N-terminal cleavage/methylation domain-containing protein [Planctomycetes bacterium]|nr:prepilin-type N-terminal cleavage/methylation domain-containing protein [Planctomycetota bacterium]